MFQSQDEFFRQNLWGQGGAGQTCHNRGGDPEVEGDWGYANEEAGFFLKSFVPRIHRWESICCIKFFEGLPWEENRVRGGDCAEECQDEQACCFAGIEEEEEVRNNVRNIVRNNARNILGKGTFIPCVFLQSSKQQLQTSSCELMNKHLQISAQNQIIGVGTIS